MMTQISQSIPQSIKTKGFTLVELLVVIFILGALALTATFFVDGLDEQTRFDDTKSRLQQIRRAIIGDASRTLNSQPDLRGYLADMGRFPNNLAELIELNGQALWGMSTLLDADLSPVEIKLFGGWRGPYLEALPETDGVARYRDGWANGGLSDVNYGWQYSLTGISGVVSIEVQSFGANGISEVPPNPFTYDTDYPASGTQLIEPNDYLVSLDGMRVQLNKPIVGTPSENLVLRVYFIDNGAIVKDNSLALANTGLSGVQTPIFNFNNQPFYMGQYAAVLLCDSAPMTFFDGDCLAPHTSQQPYYFTLPPRAQLPTIPWNIQ